MREKREDFKNRRTKEFLTELLEFIESEKSEGNENTISKEKVIAYLEEKEKELTDLISDKGSREFDRSTLPISGTVIEDEKVVLRVISPAEKEKYMKVSEQCAFSPTVFESTKDYLWESFLSNNAFVCSIYDTGSNDYVGYCSIKELDASDWEIAIELLEEYRNKGFGTAALTLFMGRVTEITGNRFYKYLIDIDNEASQKLARKIGAYPDGLKEFLLHGEELDQFKQENIDMIDDRIKKLAEEFSSDPEDLIGLVLQYRVDMSGK